MLDDDDDDDNTIFVLSICSDVYVSVSMLIFCLGDVSYFKNGTRKY